MIQGSFIQQSIRDGSCVLYHDYRLGHALDLSGNGNNGTIGSPAFFQRSGVFIRGLGNGYVLVPASASIDLDVFTSVSFFQDGLGPSPLSNVRQLARKQTAVGLSWSIRCDTSVTGLTLRVDAAASPVWSASRKHDGVRYYGASMQTGTANNTCYYDGVAQDTTMNVALSITKQPTADLYIGNIYTLGRGTGGAYSAYLMFNRILTDTEHARLYGELMK